MAVLGVSVYPDLRPLSEIEDYLARAARHGYTRVFSSMFSVGGSNVEVLALFARLNAAAHAQGMEVSLDINPECMGRLGARPDELRVFAEIDTDILRMDGAYGVEENLQMLKNPYGLRIEYNASALESVQIDALLQGGVDKDRILACHNFYPQRYTGFRWDKFRQVTESLRERGLRVGAFVASHASATHGVWDAVEGLPTVEFMRDYPAELQARLLVAAGATEVFFGNAYASDEELASVAEALTGDTTRVRVELDPGVLPIEREILLQFSPHMDMGDSSEWMWRSRLPRVKYADQSIRPRQSDGAWFQPGDVLMVNDNYKHYAGEVQVVLRPMANDGMRNLIGHIAEQEFGLFDLIDDFGEVVFLA